MDSTTIREAWEECTVEDMEEYNGSLIDPAVFEPQLDEDFIFEDRFTDEEDRELWSAFQEMEGIAFMMEPLDGFFRGQVYVAPEYSDVSVRTYTNRIKISPADTDCTYEAFEHFINEFEDKVCELKFLGGLEEME